MKLSILILLILCGLSLTVHAKKPIKFQSPEEFARDWYNGLQQSRPTIRKPKDDSQFIYAASNQRDLFFIQAANVKVIQILADDIEGSKHQRWYVQLSNGEKLFAVYNLDITPRIPLEVNQKLNIGGEFKWTNQGALIHWLHEDPKKVRPDGFVELNGKRYGKIK